MSQLSLRTTEVIAIEINSIREQTQRILLFNSIEIGRRLSEAKAMLPHGEWGNWLADSVDYSQSTAGNLMKIFETYGSDQLSLFGDNSNSQALANLSYTQAVALLGVPEGEREQFVVDNKVEEISTRELKAAIKDLQQANKDKEAAEKREEKERKTRENLEKQQKEHEDIVRKLNEQIKQAQEAAYADPSDVDDQATIELQESLDKSKEDLSLSQAKIKKLEAELKAKPIEVQATVEVEKIPHEIEKELEELRKKVAENTGEDAALFKAHFKGFTDGFSNVLSSLEVLEKSDSELHEKYKSAVSRLLGKMLGEL
ncbi:DUF3102 domain-containing protein [Paenibacillus macquariensis]|uniref:DUF3102 domain-containing protein n=1 Tax=Paenibacillus macquariensis TaxID=948756 RepID=A0ABY1JRZ8_9BACL|nr:DUF3102 domain-containing protein [Paenibacillus macquariensis]MEC0092862.1 DUF3102 domain-containing protein [Paenibacillus macquariensis]OAB36240.1 hypothetical protein PMSM_07260 [Paenibacillus macquariensis subsp. macquariensis]SIQ67735.1 Protein of unknown function [Paenibacillus macquariensis]